MKFSFKPQRLELLTVDQTGALPFRVAGGGAKKRPLPFPYTAPSWSPDGNLIAFSALTGPSRDQGPRVVKIFVAESDGSALRQVPGTSRGYEPVFAPDGQSIAFARTRERRRPNDQGGSRQVYESASVWVVDIYRGEPRQLTPWRNGVENFPSSFSPDGSILGISHRGRRRGNASALALRLDSGGLEVLAPDAAAPVYSPDGSEIAFLRLGERATRPSKGGVTRTSVETTSDLFVMNADGKGIERLTRTPTKLELAPSWDPSGQRLAYTQFRGGGSEPALFGFGSALMQINADGSCRTKLLSARRTALVGAAWQPGTGREAGRIEC